jgi:hypothetical protein
MGWHVARIGKTRNPYRIFVWKPIGKRPFGKHGMSCEDNIRMNIRKVVLRI